APASFSARATSHSRIMWLIIPGRPSSRPSSGEKMRATPRECSRSIPSWPMTPPPPPNTFTWPAPRSASSSTRYVKYSTCPPWYALIATPWASSAIAAVTTSSTERLCPRWITSAPCDCRMRRMMLMEASCPSNRLAAVTNRTGCTGRCSSVVMPPKYLDFLLIQRRPSRATTGFARDDRLSRGRGRRATGRHGRPSADRPRVVHAPDREPLLHRVLDHGDQRLLRRLAFPGVAAHERDALVDGQRLTHVVQVVLQHPVERVHPHDVRQSAVLEEVDRGERVREPAGVREHDRTARTAHQVVPHEPEALLSGGAEQVQDQVLVQGDTAEVHRHRGGGLVRRGREVVDAGARVRHHRLGRQRHDLGDRTDERGLARTETAGHDDLGRGHRLRRGLARCLKADGVHSTPFPST